MDVGHRPGREDELGIFIGDLIVFLALGQQIAEGHAGLIGPQFQGNGQVPGGQGNGGLLIVIAELGLLAHHRLPSLVAGGVGYLAHGELVLQRAERGLQSQFGGLHQRFPMEIDLIIGYALFQPEGDFGAVLFQQSDLHFAVSSCRHCRRREQAGEHTKGQGQR